MRTDRLSRHERTAAALAALGDDEFAALLTAAPTDAIGVGGASTTLVLDGATVFLKRIPITDRELANPRSTANLFDLPLICQYGMHRLAGPGFGAWRELEANLVATRGAIAEGSDAVALLHHWRVLPGRPPVAAEHRDLDAVVQQFAGSPAVRARFEELAAARSSLVLVLEHAPSPVTDLLTDPVGFAEEFERQLLATAAFLRRHDLIHLDAHLGNLRADGDRIVLVDFGLATSPRFTLSDDERAFVAEHRDHDADYVAARLVNWLVTTACRVPMPPSGPPLERDAYVRRCAGGDIPRDVPAAIARVLARHSPAAAAMNAFHQRLVDGDLDARYVASRGHP